MATPLAVDQFSRWMAEKFDERKIIGVPTVFQSFFGRPEHGSQTRYEENAEVVEIDIIRGNERTAALIHRGTNAQHMGDMEPKNRAQNYSSFSRQYPLAEEESSINAAQILSRVAGENPYSGRARVDRMRELAGEYYAEHIRKYVRLFEVLAAMSLLTGQQPAIMGTLNADFIYDFRRNVGNTITPAIAWDQPGADILGDIDGGCDILRQNGHVTPNVLFLAGTEVNSFISNPTVQTLADNRRFELINVNSAVPVPANLAVLVAAGATALGRIVTPRGRELWVMTYNDIFTAPNGTPTKYLPDGWALLAYYGARCDRYFGPPELLPMDPICMQMYQFYFGFNAMAVPVPPLVKNASAVISPAMFYNSMLKLNDKVISMKTQSAPIFATTQTDAFVTFTGLSTVSS